MAGKGDKRRPESKAAIDANWERIFGCTDPVDGKTMEICVDCGTEVDGVGAGDECLYYCRTCDRIVEGNTLTVESTE